jgi:hypothetical protein
MTDYVCFRKENENNNFLKLLKSFLGFVIKFILSINIQYIS